MVLINLWIAIPFSSAVTASELKKPGGREEIDHWMALFDSWGLDVDRSEFEAAVIDVTGRISAVDKATVAPFKPWMRLTGTGQAWALFASPDTHPHRFTVDGRSADGEWEVYFRRLDPEHAEMRDWFTYRRIRGIYDGSATKQGRTYKNFARWVARELMTRHPELDEVRVRQIRTHTTVPGLEDEAFEREEAVRVVKRADAFGEDE